MFQPVELEAYQQLLPSYFPLDEVFPRGVCTEENFLAFNPNDVKPKYVSSKFKESTAAKAKPTEDALAPVDRQTTSESTTGSEETWFREDKLTYKDDNRAMHAMDVQTTTESYTDDEPMPELDPETKTWKSKSKPSTIYQPDAAMGAGDGQPTTESTASNDTPKCYKEDRISNAPGLPETDEADEEAASVWYYAYGSNMDEKQLSARIGGFKERRLMRLDGYSLVFNKVQSQNPKSPKAKLAFANIEVSPNGTVFGIAYSIHPDQLEEMDGYEGVPKHYTRQQMRIRDVVSNTDVTCAVYVAAPASTAPNLLPAAEYIRRLLCGRDLLPAAYVAMIESHPTGEEEATDATEE